MNPISKAINDIKMTIPKEILDIAYNDNYSTVESIESKLEMVIRNRVLVDTNLVKGVTTYVPMQDAIVLDTDEYGGIVVEIPEQLLDSRAILSVHSLVSNSLSGTLQSLNSTSTSCETNNGAVLLESKKIAGNLSSTYTEVTSNIEIIGERILYIRDRISNLRDTSIRLVVENQRLLNNIPPRAYINFSMLVSKAIKADIYNKLIVKLDQGYIHTGHNMGIVQTIIEKYEDMNDLYLEYLTDTWTSVMFMSDNVEMSSYVTSLFPNNL